MGVGNLGERQGVGGVGDIKHLAQSSLLLLGGFESERKVGMWPTLSCASGRPWPQVSVWSHWWNQACLPFGKTPLVAKKLNLYAMSLMKTSSQGKGNDRMDIYMELFIWKTGVCRALVVLCRGGQSNLMELRVDGPGTDVMDQLNPRTIFRF